MNSPQEWRRMTVGDLFDFVNGNGFKPSDWTTEGFPIIRIQNLNGSNNYNYYNGEIRKSWIVDPGQLLFAWAGTRGVSFGPHIWKGPKGVLNQHIYKLMPRIEGDNRWLYYILARVTEKIERKAHGFKSTLLHVQKSDIVNQVVAVPPKCEQKAIADLLSTWDEAIEKTERLIQAKERRFRWLLRNFLAATTHLTTSRSWHETVLGRICSITKGTQKNRDSLLPAGEYPVMNGGITPSGYTDEWNTEAHTITISEGGNSCGFVSLMEKRFWCGGHCYALKDLDETIFDHRFLFFYLKSHEPKIMRLRVGSGLPNIQKSDMERFPIKHPSLKEQRKIAELLSVAQQEIDLLKKLSEKYKTQKRGLMQKLLTGQWRVNFDEEVA